MKDFGIGRAPARFIPLGVAKAPAALFGAVTAIALAAGPAAANRNHVTYKTA